MHGDINLFTLSRNMHYGTIVVGGGIAGLSIALQLAKDKQDVCILERYRMWGGRVATYRDPKNDIQYEIGAGRINTRHARINNLVQRYGLHTFPMSVDKQFEHSYNAFNELFAPIRAILQTLPNLGKHTIGELVPHAYTPILRMYPYWAEIYMLRADLALPLFEPQNTMGNKTSYYGISEGIDSITTHLAADADREGAVLKNRHRVQDIQQSIDGRFVIKGDFGKRKSAKPFAFTCDRVILAISIDQLMNNLPTFSILQRTPLLKHLATSPLIRIYAVYPKTEDNMIWFADLPEIVTNNPLRHVIPIDVDKGLIMISYTDGEDTVVWKDMEGVALTNAIQNFLHALFPDSHIPMPTYLQKHVWNEGCTYWLPGDYDVVATSMAAHNPAKNVFICGESISLQQTWMEGALQSADTLYNLPAFRESF